MRGRKFHVSNVKDILQRSTYRGKHPNGVHDVRNGIKRSEDEWQIIDVPVIIPEAEWLEVQAGIARNARHITAPTFVSGPTMLAGIAKCDHPECGHALTIATGKGGRYRYYRCSRRLRRGETACQGITIRDGKFEDIVIDAMAERLLRPERLQELLASQRSRRADLEQEILLVERQLSAADRRVTSDAIDRLGEVILSKLRSSDTTAQQGHVRRFIAKVVVAPDLITIGGPIKPLAIAANDGPEQQAPTVPSFDREWCQKNFVAGRLSD